jgi:outer membrane receptor protein involved in Fe transport
MKLRLFTNPLIVLFLFFLIPGFLWAGNTGKIMGKVVDKSTGEPLAGVNVIIEDANQGAASDLDGTYFIIGIRPGTYTLVASYISYQDIRVSNVEVQMDKTTTIDFEMSSATLELDESIEVVAERPLIRKDLTSTEATVGKELIEVLPVVNLNEVINLQAGVIDGHFRGGRTDEVQYLVNGVSINDAYSGSYAIEVENNAIQEVNIISGTFNAEYGRAMSGIVNVVTRDGGPQLEGNLSGFVGDYVSTRDNIYWNINNFNPILNLQGTLSGPVPFLGNNFTFFASGRAFYDNGYLFASDVFKPSDQNDEWLTVEVPEERNFISQGREYQFTEELAQELIENSDKVSLNEATRYSGNLKLTWRVTNSDRLNLEGLFQTRDWKEYSHSFRLNPDGSYNYNRWSGTGILSWNHVFSNRTFLDTYLSYFYTEFFQGVYDDRFDTRYVTKQRLQDTGANAFVSGGQEMWQFQRSTTTYQFKADLTSQVNNHNQFKFGVEARSHRLWMHEYEVIPELEQRVAPITSFQNNQYMHYPIELAAYVQDKMEYEDMVVNFGIRYDYFDPDGYVPQDFSQPSTSPLRKAEPSHQVSPRLGLAYPISESGVIHVSYGHFFQIPQFFYLYTNPEFDIDPLQSTVSPPPQSLKNTVGNAELEPQQTTIYEIGLQQQLSNVYGITFTVYFKDIRNLVGTEVNETLSGIKYGRYINRDYGYVRGFTFKFERRYIDNIAANIDYTYQIAKGNASDPNNAFLDAQNDSETEKQVVPLDWDRTHQFNGSINIGNPKNFVFSLIARYGTGLPYTTASRVVQPFVENGGRKPVTFTVDVYLIKKFEIGAVRPSVFLRIFNIFDRQNELDVYSDTGRASYSTEPLYFGGGRPRGLNTLDQYYTRPNYYGKPREIQIGFEINF